MSVLAIGATERARIAELLALAAANPVDPATAQATADKDIASYRKFMESMTVVLPVGYYVTYSHERQSFGLARHISISMDRPSKMPSIPAVEMILQEFGMEPMRGSPGLWIEDVGPAVKAINIVQPVVHHASVAPAP
jgi:hypothetical protein